MARSNCARKRQNIQECVCTSTLLVPSLNDKTSNSLSQFFTTPNSMSKETETVYNAVPADEADTPTKEIRVQEPRCRTKKRILIALATMMFIGGMTAIIIDDESGHHDHPHHGHHHHHFHHHHDHRHKKRHGVWGHYVWVPDDNTVTDEDIMYCNEHEWCRKAKEWFKTHGEESITETESSSSDSSDDSNDSNDSNFITYFKNSKPGAEDEALEVEELPPLNENVQEKTEGLLRGGKVTHGGN